MIRLFIFAFLLCANCVAQREPVLKQIDLPHAYYYREMYLPQLTTGPSAAAWSPDSRTLSGLVEGCHNGNKGSRARTRTRIMVTRKASNRCAAVRIQFVAIRVRTFASS